MSDFFSRVSSTKFLTALAAGIGAVLLAVHNPTPETIAAAIGALAVVGVAYNVAQGKVDAQLAEKGAHRAQQ